MYSRIDMYTHLAILDYPNANPSPIFDVSTDLRVNVYKRTTVYLY